MVPLWGIALIGAMLQKRGKAFDSTHLLLIAASLGFGLVYFLQRKGWPYHSYPMIVFALLAFGCAMTPGDDRASLGRGRLAGAAAALAALFMLSMVWFNLALDARPLQAAVARLGQHPTILAISGMPASVIR
jgi:hypothetical protein